MLIKNSALILSMLFLSMPAIANEIELGGNQSEINFRAFREITKTEYSYEPYDTICTRDVVVGRDTVCTQRVENKCEKIPGVGVVCKDEVVGETCSSVDRTEPENYECVKYTKVPYQVHDYDVNANITVIKNESAQNFDLNDCNLNVKLAGDSESFYAICEKAIVKAKVLERKETLKGRDKERKIKVSLNFATIEDLSALKEGAESLEYNNGKLTFNVADLRKANNFQTSVSITRNRLLLKDKVIFSKNLNVSDFDFSDTFYTKVKASLDLNKIGGSFDSTKKHTLKLVLKTLKKVDLQDAINYPALKNEIVLTTVVND